MRHRYRTGAASVRFNGFLVAACLIPLVGGCVSAINETATAGFAKPGTATLATAGTPAATPDKPESTGSEATAPQAAAAAAPARSADVAAKASEKATGPGKTTSVAALEAETARFGAPREGPLATGPAAVAAFAGASVLTASQTEPASAASNGAASAKSSMFASLYAQSAAKTPIRNADAGKARRVLLPRQGVPVSFAAENGAALPGVRNNASLFEIGQKASAAYDADILDEATGEEGFYQSASLSGMARLAPNGLMVQRPDVETSCFQPDLVSIIRAVETKFGTKVVVTSGYRNPSHNLRVHGARKSMHLQCKAADILVPRANKFTVAAFVRTLPNRGGVGTYCHTDAIHVDTGRQRDWNWACRGGPQTNGLLLVAQKGVRAASD